MIDIINKYASKYNFQVSEHKRESDNKADNTYLKDTYQGADQVLNDENIQKSTTHTLKCSDSYTIVITRKTYSMLKTDMYNMRLLILLDVGLKEYGNNITGYNSSLNQNLLEDGIYRADINFTVDNILIDYKVDMQTANVRYDGSKDNFGVE